MEFRRVLFGLAACALLLFTGCASIVSGQNQSVSVVTRSDGGAVSGAKCALVNDKGTWYATTPGSVTVRRSFNDLMVDCSLSGYPHGVLAVKSATKGLAFGNILFGGFIGAGVDMSTGAAYDYPEVITVQLGDGVATTPAIPAPATPVALPGATVAKAIPVVAPVQIGQNSFQVERLAREQACHTTPLSSLVTKGPGFETYTVTCADGDAWMFRCEFGNCRLLQ